MRRDPATAPSWAALATVALVALALYANSLAGALVYDDVNAIRNNPFVRGEDVAGIFTTPSWWGISRGPLWRPLTTLTFAANHAVHGLDPVGYHAVNVVLHAVVSVLVLLVFAAVTAAPRIAFAGALLFAAHPIHTEAVASVVGRAELMAAAGFFVAWYCWLAADRSRGGAVTAWLAATVVTYFLAMCGKETAIALPAVLVVADLVTRGSEPVGALVRRRLPRHAALAATALLFVVARSLVLGLVTPSPDLLDNPLSALSPVGRVMTAVKIVGLYALRLVFPLWLSADYSFDQITAVASPLDAGFLGGLVVLVGTPALAWWGWRRAPALAIGAALLGCTFAVVGNLFFLIGTIMGERLAYLPSAGFCLMLAVALAWISGEATTPGRAPARWMPAFAVGLGAVVALYGARTVGRNAVWRDPIAFFTAMVADAPRSARSHRELGIALADAGRFEESRQAFDRSLTIKAEDATTLYNLGNTFSSAGRFAEAVDVYQRAVAVNPTFVEALENLGNAESLRGNQHAALAAMRRALVLNPDSAILLMNIANTLFLSGAHAEARTTYERALTSAPGSVEIRTNFGAFLYSRGDFTTAVRVLEPIPPPAPPRALTVLVASYHALGRTADAQAAQATAERLYPQDAGLRQTAELLRRDAASAGASP